MRQNREKPSRRDRRRNLRERSRDNVTVTKGDETSQGKGERRAHYERNRNIEADHAHTPRGGGGIKHQKRRRRAQRSRPEGYRERREGLERGLASEKDHGSDHAPGGGREEGVGRLTLGMRETGREGGVEGWDLQKDEGNPGEEGRTPGHDPEGHSNCVTVRTDAPVKIDTGAESENGRAGPGAGGINARKKARHEVLPMRLHHY